MKPALVPEAGAGGEEPRAPGESACPQGPAASPIGGPGEAGWGGGGLWAPQTPHPTTS